MADKIQFPSAIHSIQMINTNIVNNLLAGRVSFINVPSLYERAYTIVYETGEIPVSENIAAPDETTSTSGTVRIFSKTS
jgi:hypothetical protein